MDTGYSTATTPVSGPSSSASDAVDGESTFWELGRCKKAYLDEPESQLSPRYLVIKVDEAKLAVYDSEQKALDKIEEQYSDPGNWVEQQVN